MRRCLCVLLLRCIDRTSSKRQVTRVLHKNKGLILESIQSDIKIEAQKQRLMMEQNSTTGT